MSRIKKQLEICPPAYMCKGPNREKLRQYRPQVWLLQGQRLVLGNGRGQPRGRACVLPGVWRQR